MNNSKTKIDLRNNLDKLLFVFATVYLMLVAGWFWKQQQKIISSSSSNVVNSSEKPISNYPQTLDIKNEISSPSKDTNLQLTRIATNRLQTPISSLPRTSLNSEASTNTLTIPPLPNTNIAADNPFPPPPSLSPLPIPQPPQPILSSPPPSTSVATITPPPPSPRKLMKVPTISTLNTNTENNDKVSSIAAIAKETPKETDYNYTLIGIVELENSGSVALFNINNLTEKVSLGNEIGTTGWVLMGVNGTQAVITRQDQSVYLRVGETF